jgi:superfamily I DNA and/or RNA helicase
MSMVRHILSSSSDTLTLLAFTNRAVEELGAKLRAAGIDYLRIGHENADEKEQTLSSISVGRKINKVRDMVQSYRVFLSTVSAFAVRANDLAEVVKLDQVIVDEASQLTEIQLVGSLAYFKKWILVGDQMQLPSVVVQSECLSVVKDESLHGIAVTDMRHSLFERLQRMLDMKSIDSHSAMLDVHFRMHEDIAALVNDFYDGKLHSGSERQRASSDRTRVMYYPSPHEDSYKKHIAEARRVVSLLQEIKQEYGENFSYTTVGVVTPFRAQIAVIRDMIEDDELREKVVIDTVERFQGGERDIIIASMAVCTPGQMKMVSSLDASGRVDRKLNVMVSRSRERFILLGEKEALQGSEFYSELLDRCTTM